MPPHAAAPAASGSVFELHPEVKDDWLKWSPGLSIAHGSDAGAAPGKDEPKRELVHHKPEAEKDSKSHHWFHHLFHHGD